MRCFFCKGAAHPSTGHQYTPNVLACKVCFVLFRNWVMARVKRNPIAAAAQTDRSWIGVFR